MLSILPLLSKVYEYVTFARLQVGARRVDLDVGSIMGETFSIIRHLLLPPSSFVFSRATASIFRYIIVLQFFLSGMSGVTSHLASQVHVVVQNTRSITSAICALPIPFANSLCAGIREEARSPVKLNTNRSPAWHLFLINEDLHGPVVDFVIRKAINATSIVLAFVRASDLPRRHEISDKLKDFLQSARASELSSATHLSLVKIVIDE